MPADGAVLGAMARAIVDANTYMTLGTADATGRPWLSPVYFSTLDRRHYHWISSPDAQHSRNIAIRPEVSIVVFDSRAAVGSGQALYIAATATEATGSPTFDQAIAAYNARATVDPASGGRILNEEELRPPAPYRLYRATADQCWVLDPDSSPDARVEVRL